MAFKLVDLACKICDNVDIDVMVDTNKKTLPKCSKCGKKTAAQLSFAGYNITGKNNAGTTRPANSGAFRGRKR